MACRLKIKLPQEFVTNNSYFWPIKITGRTRDGRAAFPAEPLARARTESASPAAYANPVARTNADPDALPVVD